MAIAEGTPFALLRQLDRLGREHQAPLPSRDEPGDFWTGVGFRLGSQHLVSSMDEVAELLKQPELSPVPRARHWVRGIANVRGNLLPVMDLNGYLHGTFTTPTRASRVLVIHAGDLVTGLLVDEVFGMRQFPVEDRRWAPGDVDPALAPYVSGVFESDNEGGWLLFSMTALAEHPDFMKVAG